MEKNNKNNNNWIHLLARRGAGKWIHLSMSPYKLCALYICPVSLVLSFKD